MATLASSPPTSPSWPKRRSRAWALRCERYCCAAASCFPLAFVYGLTTWAVYVEASIGFKPSRSAWIGFPSSALGLLFYGLLNASYSVAVFTDPGSPLTTRRGNNHHEYSALPVTEHPEFTSYTVSSTGGSRYCKKCQCPKPDRAHHCSTCKRCVLKMDHHCPWLATCVGLYNYKAFLLFLIYTSLFCWVCFAASSVWVWTEVFNDTGYMETVLPVNVVLLSVLSGIIGLVLTGFTAWHISLAARGTTTIECLEKTRYVSPLRKALDRQHFESGPPNHDYASDPNESFSHRLQGYGNQIIDAHANAIPGVTRAEEGEERLSPAPYTPAPYPPGSLPPASNPPGVENHLTPAQQALSRSYADMERQRERERYQEYLNEQDSEKMPSAFDLGWRRNLLHLFGDRALLWALPVRTTTGDGWRWEPSQRFLEARDRARARREQDTSAEQEYYRDLYQRNADTNRSWAGSAGAGPPAWVPARSRTPERPPTSVSMQTLAPASPRPRPGDSDYEDYGDGNGLLDPEAARPRRETDEWRDWD
ncbi:hypothetical protein NUU61_004356 [Penicillium alfredii]|uniref:Palmitoyltransferase n=1 Tax=Penicillium alfredii TaxID=1506179 RepID=A0A9W9KD99_9EURO|nr:uncharacterized protein NUU61_004356 [Penicillium alfredii]KAJ5102134.1 hypothetical protein NUU61_004356 [Penicillium alfredii]